MKKETWIMKIVKLLFGSKKEIKSNDKLGNEANKKGGKRVEK